MPAVELYLFFNSNASIHAVYLILSSATDRAGSAKPVAAITDAFRYWLQFLRAKLPDRARCPTALAITHLDKLQSPLHLDTRALQDGINEGDRFSWAAASCLSVNYHSEHVVSTIDQLRSAVLANHSKNLIVPASYARLSSLISRLCAEITKQKQPPVISRGTFEESICRDEP